MAARRLSREGLGADAVAQRLGRPTLPRPEGPLVWCHVGAAHDLASVAELLTRLRRERPDLAVLLTTSVPVAAPPGIPHQLRPLDTGPAVRRFLAHWRPDAALWVGNELWPMLASETHEARIPLVYVDARLARRRVGRVGAGPLLAQFRAIITGSAADAAELRRLGAPPERVEAVGFLEEGTSPLPCNEAELAQFATLLAGRPIWLAAAVEPNEVPLVVLAHRDAARLAHRLLLILAPSDTSAGPGLVHALEAEGWRAALRSADQEPERDTQIYVVDLADEMGLWYRLAEVSFLGGTLAPDGPGHNPHEAAALGSAILHGPGTGRFAEAFRRLDAAGGARVVRSAGELGAAVEALQEPDRAAAMAHAAWNVTSSGAEVTDRVRELILGALEERRG